MRELIAYLIAASALAACSTLDLARQVSDSDQKSIKSVGVVSLLGENLTGVRIGITVFGNATFTAHVPDWNIEDLAAERVVAMMRGHPGIKVAKIDRMGMSDASLRDQEFRAVWELANTQGVGTVVLILPTSITMADSGLSMGYGYGLFERTRLLDSKHCVYVSYAVNVFDVTSRRRIAWQPAINSCLVADQFGIEGDIPFRENFAAYSDEEKSKMRMIIERRLSNSVREVLENLKLP